MKWKIKYNNKLITIITSLNPLRAIRPCTWLFCNQCHFSVVSLSYILSLSNWVRVFLMYSILFGLNFDSWRINIWPILREREKEKWRKHQIIIILWCMDHIKTSLFFCHFFIPSCFVFVIFLNKFFCFCNTTDYNWILLLRSQ